MAYTVTANAVVPNDVWGKVEVRNVTLAPAASDYPTGGYALTPGSGISLNKIYWAIPEGGQGGIDPVWNPTTGKLQMFATSVGANTPLGLGPVSAAKSTAIGVASNVTTVTIANSLKAGQFVYLQSFTAGGALNGTIAQVQTASATQFTANTPGAVNITAATADVTGTYQLVQAGTGNLLTTGTAATITNVAATAASPSVMTITCANTFVPGQFVVLQGVTTATALNGAIVQVTTASASQFTANWYYQGSAITSAADTGTASLLVTAGNSPIALGQVFTSSNTLTVASAPGVSGVITITAKNDLVAGNIVVYQNLTAGASLNGDIVVVNAGNLSQTLIVGNHLTLLINTASDTTGTAAQLVTGVSTSVPAVASVEVEAGTDLSAYNFNLLLLGN